MALSSADNKKGKRKPTNKRKIDTGIDKRQTTIFFSVIIVCVAIIIGAAYYLTQTDDDDEEKNSVSIECYTPEHEIAPNATTYYVFILKNLKNDKNVVRMEITDRPENWTVYINQEAAILQKEGTAMLILTAQAPVEAENGTNFATVSVESLSHKGKTIREEIILKVKPYVSNTTVKSGKTIAVNYVGYLESGKIFDTSREDIAENDDAPKSSTYSYRGHGQYNLLEFTAGEGQMIVGFDEGVMGMHLGETKVIIVPPEKAYNNDESHDLYGKTLYFEVTLEEFK